MITSIELQVLSRILTSDDPTEVNELCSFDLSYYSVFKEHAEFIFDHKEKYGNVPDVFTFQSTFPDITLVPVKESLEFLKSELIRNKQHILLVSMFNKIKDLGAGDVTEAWEYIQAQSEYALQLDATAPMDLIKDAKKRSDQVLEFSKQTRIPTGFPEIDKLMYGGLSTVEELVIILARTNSGKAQPMWSHVLTPNGWKYMKDIKVGDMVIGADNDNGHVVQIFPQGEKDYYRMRFDDGSYAECCDDHLWVVNDKSTVDKSILTTKEIRTHLDRGYSIDVTDPIEFESNFNVKEEVAPYLLGCFLRSLYTCDLNSASLSTSFEDIVSSLIQFTNINNVNNNYVKEVVPKLREYGLTLSPYDAHIPQSYLQGPVEVRRELLSGLLGENLDKHRSTDFVFSTVSNKMVEDFLELTRSLGCFVKQPEITSFNNVDCYKFNGSIRLNNQCSKYSKTIVSVEYRGKTECQCILLDNKSHTYITNGYTTTHNTWFCVKMMENAQKNGFPVMYYSPEMQASYLGTRFDTWRGHYLNSQLYQGKYDEAYLNYIEELQKEETPAFVVEDKDVPSGSVNVPFIESFVRKHNIKLLVIDGLSYMEDSKRADTDYIKYKNIALGLFNISKKYGCAVVIAMQANRETKAEKDDKGTPFPSLYNAEGSDHPGRICTQAFALRQIFDKHVIDIRLEKSRIANNQKPVLSYAWDVNSGNVRYIPGDDDALNDVLQPSVNASSVLGGESNAATVDTSNIDANEEIDWDEDVEF